MFMLTRDEVRAIIDRDMPGWVLVEGSVHFDEIYGTTAQVHGGDLERLVYIERRGVIKTKRLALRLILGGKSD